MARLQPEDANAFRATWAETQKRWSETRRDVSALYTAQFGARNSGANP